MVKEGVGRNLHLMKVDVLPVAVHANRRGVADEMNVVAARGKFHAEFGGDDAGTTIGWIASNADAHVARFRVLRVISCAASVPYFALFPAVRRLAGRNNGC